jgi:hypothetical protein
MKNGQKLKLGDDHVTLRNIQEVQASKLGDAPEAPPFFIGKNQVTFQDTTFLLRHALCVFLGASVVFACCNKWFDHIMLFWREMNSIFYCQEHSSFHSFRSTSVLFFCYCV